MYVALQSPVAFPLSIDGYNYAWGLGDVASANQIVSGSAAAVGSAAGIAAAAGLIPLSAVPFIGPAIAGAAIAISLLIKNSGCGQTCIETSGWANQAEPLLAQNIAAYFAQPVRTQSSQQVALANFDAIWARLVQMCSDSSTGNAGKRCISDRQSGACTWKQNSTSPLLHYPGEPQPGECWNWFSGYRDPIANDAGVQPDTVASDAASVATTVSGSADQLAASVGLPAGSGLAILGIAALVVLGVMLS